MNLVTDNVKALVRRHEETLARYEAHEPVKGTSVQVTVEVRTVVLFFGVTEDDVKALSREDFEALCNLTGQSPQALENDGNLNLRHDAHLRFDPSDVLEDDYEF